MNIFDLAMLRKKMGVSSWNDLTDKPFGESGEVVEILPEIRLVADNGAMLIPSQLVFVVGNTYIINWNGVEYNCVANELTDEGMRFWVLGNYSLAGGVGDTGEPFVCMAYPPEVSSLVGMYGGFVSEDTEAVVSITGEVTTVKQIDEKFVDYSGVPLVSNLEAIDLTEYYLTRATVRKGLTTAQSVAIQQQFDKYGFAKILLSINSTNYTILLAPYVYGDTKKYGCGMFYYNNTDLYSVRFDPMCTMDYPELTFVPIYRVTPITMFNTTDSGTVQTDSYTFNPIISQFNSNNELKRYTISVDDNGSVIAKEIVI